MLPSGAAPLHILGSLTTLGLLGEALSRVENALRELALQRESSPGDFPEMFLAGAWVVSCPLPLVLLSVPASSPQV